MRVRRYWRIPVIAAFGALPLATASASATDAACIRRAQKCLYDALAVSQQKTLSCYPYANPIQTQRGQICARGVKAQFDADRQRCLAQGRRC